MGTDAGGAGLHRAAMEATPQRDHAASGDDAGSNESRVAIWDRCGRSGEVTTLCKPLKKALRTCSRSYCAPVIQCRAVLGILTYIKYAPLPALRPSLSDGRSCQIVNRFFRRSHLWPLLLPHQPLLPLRPA